MKVVILCGGSGTRLWPISKKASPKQFARIFNNESLFHLTLKRNINIATQFSIIVNELQLELCREQVNDLGLSDKCEFLVEPIGRNTAPAIALAALSSNPNETLLILPSDHLIKDIDGYEKNVSIASEFAQNGQLVTFGIEPEYPETGYGYIEAQGNQVSSFKEKPDLETAKTYIEAGNYYWNSGMFCFRAETFLSELEKHSNEILEKTRETFEANNKQDTTYRFDKNLMESIPSDSIDYAVMEKSECVSVVPSKFGWSDLGSYDSLADELPQSEDKNTTTENTYFYQSKNNLVIKNDKKMLCTFDVDDLIIVDTDDALLIGRKGESQDVKKIVEKLKEINPGLLI
jgi:mannose-1-phosphate guanylyltransferase